MAIDAERLERELLRLRQGPGIMADDLSSRLGPQLSALCSLSPGDSPAACRAKILDTFQTFQTSMKAQIWKAFQGSYALGNSESHKKLPVHRQRELASSLNCDERTVRRYVDEAVAAIIAKEMAKSDSHETGGDEYPAPTWRMDEYRVLITISELTWEVLEFRLLESLVDNLDRIGFGLAIPMAEVSTVTPPVMTVLYGAELRETSRPSPRYFHYAFELPQRLARGERHRLLTRATTPANQIVVHRFTIVPSISTELFELRVRFSLANLPRHVWCLSAVTHWEVDDNVLRRDEIAIDKFGEAITTWSQPLRRGLAYGMQWEY